MRIELLEECGFEQALKGIALSYGSYPNKKVADRLAWRSGGHNKFLEGMIVWLEIDAPRYWWSQFDTYRVGTTKQSESTMHTLLKRELTKDDFEGKMDHNVLGILNKMIRNKDFDKAKKHLPESFLQKRIVTTNYKTLQNMIQQRKTHRLKEWDKFIQVVVSQAEYPEYLFKEVASKESK